MQDVIIIGGGPAGLTAGIYASRSGLKTLLLEKISCGGQITLTDIVENYPGFPEGISGLKLAEKIKEQAEKFGTVIKNEEVIEIIKKENWIVKTENENYETLSIIVATGRSQRKLGVPKEEELTGRGVSYCATCDGAFFKGRKVLVVGGGDSAIEEAIFLTRFASKVVIVHRRERLRATKILQDRLKKIPSVELLLPSEVLEIQGENKVESVKIKNLKTGEIQQIFCEGIFIFVGYTPNTKFLNNIVETDEEGYIITYENLKTSYEGIYACGDVIKKNLRQVVTACGEGALAAYSALIYIEKLKGIEYK